MAEGDRNFTRAFHRDDLGGQVLREFDDVSLFESPCRPCESPPDPLRYRFVERDLDFRAAAMSFQPRRNDPGIVQNQYVAGPQESGKIANRKVLQAASDDQHSG